MTRKQKGHFSAKHPPGTKVDARIAAALGHQAGEFTVACVQAHAVAVALGVAPQEVGTAIDLEEGRIHECQLGLFGHGRQGKAIQAAKGVAPAVEAAIQAALDPRRRLTCAQAWRIAETLGQTRLAIADACEGMGVKIIQCQLGAFQ